MAWEKFKYAETETTLPALICVIDEMAEFLEGVDRKDMRLADKLQENIASIARLGRAAHIHVVLSTQSATGNLFPTSLKNNIGARFIAGSVASNISMMAIDSEEGSSLPDSPGTYLAWFDKKTQQYQGFFTKQKDVIALGTVKDGYNKKTGLPSEESIDMSPVEDYEDSNSNEISSEDSSSSSSFDSFEIDNSSEDIFNNSLGSESFNDLATEDSNTQSISIDSIFDMMDSNITSESLDDQKSLLMGADENIEDIFGTQEKPKLKIEKKTIKINTSRSSSNKDRRKPSGGSIIIE